MNIGLSKKPATEESETIEVLPDPVSLIESMRAVGYTTESAVADLIDNSISAGSSAIQIEYDATQEPFVAILDNGRGMNASALTDAMRHGSRNPVENRAAHDLGRFGLGLKTASLSQCRKLTVVSKKEGHVHARCWDLDFVKNVQRWMVVVPEAEILQQLPLFENLLEQESGTLVVWQSLDKLMAGSAHPVDEMKTRMEGLHHHLSFVFHRFSKKEDRLSPISIFVNGQKLDALDPFLKESPFTQPLEGQEIRLGSEAIAVQPYVLPHLSHLNTEQAQLAGGLDSLRNNQGFYIYRNRRLVIWGTWFRLAPKEEFFKLTRVQVDIPNSLDHLWSLDIKKSSASPPDIIRNRLRDLIPHFANASKLTITYPGRKHKSQAVFHPFWDRIETSHGSFRYQINTEHPSIKSLADSLGKDEQKKLQHILDLLAAALPLESIYSDMCSDQRSKRTNNEKDQIRDIASKMMSVTGLDLSVVLTLDPIGRFPQFHDAIRKELS
ncbi:ATP-binding protein [Herbaspirillum sp. C9C3]|uniref:ATP-binding protein n=1 Tax=Herbaspirillum sp. C9C3 TaxID=2735271 RepID=UPI00158573B2|nr:ATP-binding protein [Herbaspirillum sp. C9C3]NUT60040.1 ATP-binding protein [Herbaspirillum sp. C9C3]